MVRDTLFALLAQRLGNRQDLIPRMATEAQLLQEVKLERNPWTPWFLESELATATCTVGDERLALPSDFLGEIEEESLWIYETDGVTLLGSLEPKTDYDKLLNLYPGSGRPKRYAAVNEYFMLRPVADAAYVVKMRYYAKDAILDSNIENKWLKYASDVVLAELGYVLASKHMQHGELAAAFQVDAQAAWTRLYNTHTAREESNRIRQMEA